MQIGFVGLGKMGGNMALRLTVGSPDGSVKGTHSVVGFAKDPNPDLAGVNNIQIVDTLIEQGDEEAKAARRREFQEEVAPLLLRASKCPDFVIDRGHDYVFIREFTDQEKRELIALIKTF